MSRLAEPPPFSPLELVVLISGGGTTLGNLLRHIEEGNLAARVRRVISSNPAAGGLKIAAAAGIPALVIERRSFSDRAAYSAAVFASCREADPHLAVMAGFLKPLDIPPDFQHRVMNIHPALIPAFCGQGFYGLHVHRAVLEYGAKLSGCTVHFVDNHYDHGPVILQQAVPVAEDDTPETLAARVFQAECQAYPRALRLFAAGRLELQGRRVRVLGEAGC